MKKNRCRKINIKKGSFTIEAACVMSLVLFTLTGLLYLCFFVHNRSWLTAAAYEAALAGSMEECREEGKGYETASLRSKELGNTGFFGAENLQSGTEWKKDPGFLYCRYSCRFWRLPVET